MKTRAFFALVAITVLVMVSPATAQQVCSLQTIKGIYSYTCTGFIFPDPTNYPTIFVPFAEQGTIVNVGSESAGSGQQSLGGTQNAVTLYADEVVVNSDCRSTVTYTEYVNGVEYPDPVTISALILDHGEEMRSFLTNPGSVITCNLKLMSRNTQ